MQIANRYPCEELTYVEEHDVSSLRGGNGDNSVRAVSWNSDKLKVR